MSSVPYFPKGLSSFVLICSCLVGIPWGHLPSQLLELGSLSQVSFRSPKKLSVAYPLAQNLCVIVCLMSKFILALSTLMEKP